MTTETMTIHKALAELKTMDARIASGVRGCTFAVANKHHNTKIDGATIDDYRKEQASKFQSISDLINRRNAIKGAVVLSNATTKVMINGHSYSVAEAIELKNNGMKGYMLLIEKMTSDLRLAITEINHRNGDDLQQRADAHIKNMYGNQADLKNLTGEMREDRGNFIVQQSYDLVTPAGMELKNLIEELNEQVQSFMIEVDAALSVSNAVTTITIEY